MECYWIRNSEYDMARLRRESKGLVVLPLGSIESHGPHLPTGSDTLNIAHIMDTVVKRVTVAVLPVLPFSYTGAARMLPGAIHIRSDLLMDFAEQICDEVYRNGFDKVVLLHGHGGNAALDDIFVRRMLERDKPYLVYSLSATAGKGNQIAALLESTEWGHAGELETSKNLAANPDLVNLKRLGKKTFPSQPAPDVGPALSPVGWVSAHPEMAVGMPQKASEEKGDKIFAIVVDGIVDVLRKIKKDRIGPAAMRAYLRKVNGVRAKVRGKD